MLSAEGVSKHFSGISALRGVDMTVAPGEIVGLVGPNGSGKSTLLNTFSGFIRPDAGTVTFHGERIDRRRPWGIAKRGLQRTFQLPAQPERMTALEVMLTGADLPRGSTLTQSLLRPRRVRAEQAQAIERARALLDELTLLELEHHAAGSLSGGQQKLLELARIMVTRPKVILLDEPFAGVNPALALLLIDIIRTIPPQHGCAVMLVSHDLTSIYKLSDHIVVLNEGQILCEGNADRIRNDPAVVEAYLGA
jgi:branched-chain amino acid transport system ATP-binding protein